MRLEPVQAVHWERGDVGRVALVEPPEFAGEELPMLALGGSVNSWADIISQRNRLCYGSPQRWCITMADHS